MIDTPLVRRVPKVLANWATALFLMRSPNAGIFKANLSVFKRPFVEPRYFANAKNAAAIPMTTGIIFMGVFMKFDIFTTTCVGIGSSAPASRNMPVNTGITKIIRIDIAPTATSDIMSGYIMAPLILRLSAAAFSRKVANLKRIVSSIPPTSPAAIIFTNNSGNIFGCFAILSAREFPDSTLVVTDKRIFLKFWFSD